MLFEGLLFSDLLGLFPYLYKENTTSLREQDSGRVYVHMYTRMYE